MNRPSMPVLVLAWLLAGVLAGAAEPAAEEAFRRIASYTFGQSRTSLDEVARLVRESAARPEERRRIEERLLALLGQDATPDCKAFVCRQLALAGSARSVGALVRLLNDEALSAMARYALERIPGPEATSALRDALGRLEGPALVGAVNSLGERRDPAAAAALAKLLAGADRAVACAAAVALGRIGGPEAASALARARKSPDGALRAAAVDASLECAETFLARSKPAEAAAIYRDIWSAKLPGLVRGSALRGLLAAQGRQAVQAGRPADPTYGDALSLVTEALSSEDAELQAAAARAVRETQLPGASEALAAKLPSLGPAAQALLLAALAERGDARTGGPVLSLLKSPQAEVRLAAARALSRLGDATAVRPLAELAASGTPQEREAARASLGRLRGAEVDRAMTEYLASAPGPVKLELVRSLGERRAARVSGELLKLASGGEPAVRVESLKALALVAEAGDAPQLVELLIKAQGDAERREAERAVVAACRRIADAGSRASAVLAALPGAPPSARESLVRALGALGGSRALAAVRGALADPDARVQDAAFRALADWPDASANELLVELARSAPKESHRVIALRGVLRAAELARGRQGSDPFPMYRAAWDAAWRPEEKKLVLGGLSGLADLRALRMAEEALAEESLRAEAAAAVVSIASALGGSHRAEAQLALEKLARSSPDPAIRKKAEEALGSLGKKPPPEQPQ